MASCAYLRVSTDSQDVANQKHGVYKYANCVGMANLVFVEDTVTEKKAPFKRGMGRISWSYKILMRNICHITLNNL